MSEVSYRPLIEDMVFSYSRLECFEACPYRWFLKYITGCEEEPRFYSSYGSLMHSLLQRYYIGFLKARDLPEAFLEEFSDQVRGERPSDSIVQKYISSGLSYLRGFQPLPFNPIAVEAKLDFEVCGVPFTGIIDFLGEKDGNVYIVDHKSRDLKPRSKRKKPTQNDMELDEMLRQLYIYAEGVRRVFGKYPAALCFNCFRNGTLIEEPFDVEACQKALSWASNLIETIKDEEDFAPYIDFFPCRWLCGVSSQCVYNGR